MKKMIIAVLLAFTCLAVTNTLSAQDYNNAYMAWERALQLKPDFQQAKEGLQALQQAMGAGSKK